MSAADSDTKNYSLCYSTAAALLVPLMQRTIFVVLIA